MRNLYRPGSILSATGLALLIGCSGPAPGGRAPDGLLERGELQQVVDRQVARDGAALIAFLDDPNPSIRARAAFALGSVQDEAAVPVLIERLSDRDVRVREDAAFALGQSGDVTAAEALWSLLDRENRVRVRQPALEALGRVGRLEDLRRLAALQVGKEQKATLALAIARFALRDLHDPAAVERLLDDLGSADPEVRRNAAYYFGRSARTETWAPYADRVRERLDGLRTGDEAAAYLVQGLGRLGEAVDVIRIADRLQDDDWRTRVYVARALAPHAEGPARSALLASLDDESVHVGVAAAETLAGVREPDADLVALVGERIETWSGPWQVPAALLPILGRAGEADQLEDWLAGHEEIPGARSRTIAALGLLPGPEGFERLRQRASASNVGAAAAALDALAGRWRRERGGGRGRGGRSAADPTPYARLFLQALQREDRGIVLAAAGALADSSFRPFGAAAALASAYRRMRSPDDVEAMTAVLEALGRLGDPAGQTLLFRAGAEEHPVLRQVARGALERLTGERSAAPAAREVVGDVPPVDWERLAALGDRPQLVLMTVQGRIAVELDPLQAPQTVDTVLRLAAEGRYDGVPFHRVVPNFVIQGGDYERADGLGGPGFVIRSEFTRIPFGRGTIGMASSGKDTEGSQYFITHSMQPHLDGRYTAFGRVLEGLDVVDRIYEGDVVQRALVVPGG